MKGFFKLWGIVTVVVAFLGLLLWAADNAFGDTAVVAMVLFLFVTCILTCFVRMVLGELSAVNKK